MKKLLLIFAAVVAMVATSCNKDNAEEKKDCLTYEEQLSYLDATGVKLLQQFNPKDFQKLADIMKAVMAEQQKGIVFDDQTQAILGQLLQSMYVVEGSIVYMFIDTDKICGTMTIKNGVASFTPGAGKHIVLISSDGQYSADLDIKCSSRKVRVAHNAEPATKVAPENNDVFIYAPESIDIKIYHTNTVYAHAAFNTDFSKMGDDWTAITPEAIDANISGDVYINGEKSYRLNVANFTSKGSFANTSTTLYGASGDFMMSANGNLLLVASDSTYTYVPADLKVKVLDRCEGLFNGPYYLDVYMDKMENAQMSLNLQDNTVKCADGTQSTVEETFNSNNFPLTVMAGGLKLIELMYIFDFIEWPISL